MAISPTMNDQWSGKILSIAPRSHFDDPKRSSTQFSAFRSRWHFPGGGTLGNGAHCRAGPSNWGVPFLALRR